MAQVPSNLIPTRITQLQDAPVASEDGLLLYVYGGSTYKIRAGDLLSVSGVPTSRQVIAGTSLQGGGALSADVTLSVAPAGVSDTELSTTGVGAGSYGDASNICAVTVNAQGRVTSVSEVPVTAVLSNVDGVLTLEHGGTSKNLTPVAGSIVWTDTNSMQLTAAGLSGQVLVSNGTSAPSWGSALIMTDQPANVVYAGPTSGPSAPTSFRALVNNDLPVTGVTAGTYGSATQAAQVTVNDRGRITAATSVTVTPAFSSITATPTTLAGYGITDAQPLDAILTAIAGVTTGANLLPYFTGTDLAATTGFTAFARTLVDDSDAATARATLSAAVLGNNSDITSLSSITGGVSSPDYIQFDTGATLTPTVGRLGWDSAEHGLSVLMTGGNVNLQIGQETVLRVYNNTGGSLTDGQVVYCSGSQGQRLTVSLAQANAEVTSTSILGVVTEPIANNAEGFVTVQGRVGSLNTTGYADGAIIFLSATVAGGWAPVHPTAPDHTVVVGYVVKGNSAGAGSIYVAPQSGYELDELHDVAITSPVAGALLIYDATVGVWKDATLTAGTNISITNGDSSVTIATVAAPVFAAGISGGTF